MNQTYDAILIVGFGGPEKPEDVIPFLENVTRGRNIPRERLLEVAEHYQHFGGVSPINQQVRDLIAVLEPALRSAGIGLPVYWGNRNWTPMIEDTVSQMTADGVRRAAAIVLAAYSSYSSCRQYREDIARGRQAAGANAPEIDKVRAFYNHPDFIAANADRVRTALDGFDLERVHVAFTAHSIPASMAANCEYERQLTETSRLIGEQLGIPEERWKLVYQSRSGRPQDPWLEPDICDHLRELNRCGVEEVVIHPVGFLSDHIEVLFDLDEEARHLCDELGLRMVRSATVGTHPKFVSMLVELVRERLDDSVTPRTIGQFGPLPEVCPSDCCPAPQRPPGARPMETPSENS